MPHVIVKLWPGKTEAQKNRLTEKIVQDVMSVLHYDEDAISVALEEIVPHQWVEKVYKPDITGQWKNLYKKPGYTPAE